MQTQRAFLQRVGVGLIIVAVLVGGGRAGGPIEAAPAAQDGAPTFETETLPATAVEGVGPDSLVAIDGAQTGWRTLVVNLGPDADTASLPQSLSSDPGVSALPLAPGLAELGYRVVQVPADQVDAYSASLRQTAGVLSVEEPQPVFTADKTPNDPRWNMQYGPGRIQAPYAWDTTTGSATVIIAIIDTGIDLGHPDLSGKLWTNPGETAGNGLDDDHNGFIDDVRGWDFYHWDNNPSDDHNPGHGTHVAGIAAAASNNGIGIAGVAWNARLMPLKVLGANGSGSDWAVAEAITYAAKRGAKVINLSLAGSNLGSYVEAAVNFATGQGALVVAAAGNNGSAGLMQPAAYANAVGVVATDENNNRTGYSNFGNEADFAAPGHNIYSTLRGGYGHMSGTSMATPHVAGAAALLASMPTFNTPARIRDAFRLTAAEGGSAGWDAYYGWGRIQTGNALRIRFQAPPCIMPKCFKVYLPQSFP